MINYTYVMVINVMEVDMNKCNCGKRATSTWLIVEPKTKKVVNQHVKYPFVTIANPNNKLKPCIKYD
jgi:hypothetical protein